MTDEQRAQHDALARDLIAHATVGNDDPIWRASALLTAATVLIEREVGDRMATAALSALLEPTLLQWHAATLRGGVQH